MAELPTKEFGLGKINETYRYSKKYGWQISHLLQYKGIVYRALRPDELGQYLQYNELRAYCYPCPESPCCKDALKDVGGTTPENHIMSSNQLKSKTNWISTTKSIKTASLWATSSTGVVLQDSFSRKESIPEERKSSIVAEINTSNIDTLDTSLIELHQRADGLARASEEVLIPNRIPGSSIVSFYEARSVSKQEYDLYSGKKYEGRIKQSKKDGQYKYDYNYVILIPIGKGQNEQSIELLRNFAKKHSSAALDRTFQSVAESGAAELGAAESKKFPVSRKPPTPQQEADRRAALESNAKQFKDAQQQFLDKSAASEDPGEMTESMFHKLFYDGGNRINKKNKTKRKKSKNKTKKNN